MEKIENHTELAKNALTPYISSFKQIRNIAGMSGERAQYIEDILWKIIYSLDVDQAYGIWLDYIGKEVGVNRTYYTSPEDILTFDGTIDQGFGAGNFYGYGTGGNNTKNERTDFAFRNAIKAKIIQNSTDCSVDELKKALKLLYNASIVSITESYPAGISEINLRGSALYQENNAIENIKKILACCVNLDEVNFIIQNNLFKNDAFISYNSYKIPEVDDFTLEFKFIPDSIPNNPTPLISQSSLDATNDIVVLSFDSLNGLSFTIRPQYYVDENGDNYVDENNDFYVTSQSVQLFGGTVLDKEINTAKITRVGDTFKLYLNDLEVDTEIQSGVSIDQNPNLLIGSAPIDFYNRGSIDSILLINDTTSTVILNDNLKGSTLGTNNGVKFL